MIMCVFYFGLSCFLRAFIWRMNTISVRKVKISTLFGGVVVGYLVNGILPFRAGEIFRAQYLTSTTGIGRTTALSTVFIERFLDVFSLGLLLVASTFYGIHGLSSRTAMFVLIIWFFIVLIALILLLNTDKLKLIKLKMTFIPQRISDIIANFISPINQLRQSTKIIPLIIVSILVWLCNYLSLLALINQFTIIKKFEAALLLFLFMNLGMLIPSAPGSLGVVQLAFWMSLSNFGIPREQALALSFVYLAIVYLFNISIGLPYFLWAHLKFSKTSLEP